MTLGEELRALAKSMGRNAVIDGVIHDNHDPQRDTGRCVYGYWKAREYDGIVG